MTKLTKPFLVPSLVGLALSLVCAQALAQDALRRNDSLDAQLRVGHHISRGPGHALGSGNALDANLRVGSWGANPARRDFAAEVRFRNALVTGNVPGGFSFRGNVGYTAADDFRGALGSNDLFGFERDSFQSTLVGPGFRGTEALQLQMSLQMGGQGRAGASPIILRRAGTGASAGGPARGATGVTDFGFDTAGVDPYALPSGLLRSTSDYISTNALSLRVLGETQAPQVEPTEEQLQRPALPLPGIDDDGAGAVPEGPAEAELEAQEIAARRMYAVASPLLGVGIKRSPQYLQPTATTRLETTRVDGRAESALDTDASTRIDSRVSYESFYESLQRQADLATGVGIDLPDVFDEAPEESPVREPGLPGIDDTGDEPGLEAPEGELEAPGATEPTAEFNKRLDRLARSLSPESRPADAGGEEAGEDETLRGEALREEAAALLGSGEFDDVETLAPPTPAAQRNLYREHMMVAEEALREGRYFDAEERFSSALRIRGDDPMAAAGRVNAQLGAGMFLSAAVNLSQLLRAYPELIPIRFDEEIMPDRERIEIIRSELRRQFGRETELARQAAMLYAYASHQMRDQEGVAAAFEEIDRITTERAEQSDPLYDALRAVWLKSRK